MFTTIIVDRVGNTNVFNVIQNDINQQLLSESNSLQSITDDDLIQEYLTELTDISQFSRSLAGSAGTKNPDGTLIYQHMDVAKRLHQIGETFFRQFFPPLLQDIFNEKKDEYIFFYIDPALASIPLEILSNGKYFLWENFYIGKSIKGRKTPATELNAKDTLNMLIIADPTEDLEWARREGEELFEHLSSNFPEKRLQIELIAGKHITKLSLLNDIVGKDIIHFSGHLHYTNDLQENGWLLYDNKIVHAREIQKSGASPILIFSNSCVSGRNLTALENKTSWYENFASSFIKSGHTSYIGTIWELPDTQQTLKFTLELYDNIFQGHPVGYSLYMARKYAKDHFPATDLTWASYLLMGNPVSKIFQKESKLPDFSRNTLEADLVLKKYPFPIARSYFRAFEPGQAEKIQENPHKLENLFLLFSDTVCFLSALVFTNYQYLNISKPFIFDPGDLGATFNSTLQALNIISILKMEPMIPNISDTLLIHKEEILKIIAWKELFVNGRISLSSLEGYVISLQYLIERMLLDMEYLKIYGFYRIMEPGIVQLSLMGLTEYHSMKEIILPTQSDYSILEELTIRTTNLTGKCVFYIPVKRIFLDLSAFLELTIEEGESSVMNYDVVFKAVSQNSKMPVIIKGKKTQDSSPQQNSI